MILFPDIKPGDEVAFKHSRWSAGEPYRNFTIKRVTKTQIVTADGNRWSRETGKMVGSGSWSSGNIHPWTDERRAEQQRLRRVRSAEEACRNAAERLKKASGDEALRLAALLPDELKEPMK